MTNLRKGCASPSARPVVRAWAARVACTLVFAACNATCLAQGASAADWSQREGVSITDGTAAPDLSSQGWVCPEAVALQAPGQTIALCRRAPARTGELFVVHRIGVAAGAPIAREVSGLRDASQAHLRLFAPAHPCSDRNAGGCLAAVVLVDEWDESSCYGTQVLTADAAGKVRSLGFIDLVLIDGSQMRCIGTVSKLSGNHRSATATVEGGRLARIGRNGRSTLLANEVATYRISTTRLTALPFKDRQ